MSRMENLQLEMIPTDYANESSSFAFQPQLEMDERVDHSKRIIPTFPKLLSSWTTLDQNTELEKC